MNRRLTTAIRVGTLVLMGGVLSHSALAGMFPAEPTVNDDVYAVLKYPCPYPDPDNPPVIKRDNGLLTMEATTEGTVCFDHAIADRDYAYNLGKLQPGAYTLTVQHRYRLGNGRPSEFFWTNIAERKFTVVEGIPNRISGIWAAVNRSKDGFNITLLDRQTAFVTWNTNTPTGEPLWLYGSLVAKGNRLDGIMFQNKGLKFGELKTNTTGNEEAWGSLSLELRDCGLLEATWKGNLPEYGSGGARFGLLSNPRGVEGCVPDANFAYGRLPLPIQ